MRRDLSSAPADAVVLTQIRRFLLVLFVLGSIATEIELLLLEHTEDLQQLIPIVLNGVGIVVLVWAVASARPVGLLIFRGVMMLFLLSGLVGMILHYNGNVEFALELHPELAGWELFWKALRGGFPILGPAVMMELGLLGLAYTYKHPILISTSVSSSSKQGE